MSTKLWTAYATLILSGAAYILAIIAFNTIILIVSLTIMLASFITCLVYLLSETVNSKS